MSGIKNKIPHADTSLGVISASSSDRVEAPVAGAGFTDCGGSQTTSLTLTVGNQAAHATGTANNVGPAADTMRTEAFAEMMKQHRIEKWKKLHSDSVISVGDELDSFQYHERPKHDILSSRNRKKEAIANEDMQIAQLSEAIFALQRVCRNRKNIGNEVREYVDVAVLSSGELKRFRELWKPIKPLATVTVSQNTQECEKDLCSPAGQLN